jgi:YD repeat-containing protein
MTSRGSAGVTESYTYDQGAYGKGRLTRMDDATGYTSYQYDAAGALVQQTNNVYGTGYTTGWTYDPQGRRATMTYPSGLRLTYGYDSVGRLSGVTSTLAAPWSCCVPRLRRIFSRFSVVRFRPGRAYFSAFAS